MSENDIFIKKKNIFDIKLLKSSYQSLFDIIFLEYIRDLIFQFQILILYIENRFLCYEIDNLIYKNHFLAPKYIYIDIKD